MDIDQAAKTATGNTKVIMIKNLKIFFVDKQKWKQKKVVLKTVKTEL